MSEYADVKDALDIVNNEDVLNSDEVEVE